MTRAAGRGSTQSRAGGEFALIDAFLKPFGAARDGANFGSDSGVRIGPGDDCAQLVPSRGKTLIATTDAALDGVHFELGRATPEDAGWKALAMNLSDLAAAGATPRWFLCALGVPFGAPAGSLGGAEVIGTQNIGLQSNARRRALAIARRLGRGMAQLAKQSGCALVGGNVARAAQWSLTITALGEAKRPLSRAGGKPGDRLLLVGELGAAALGLSLLQATPPRSSKKIAARQPSMRKPALAAGERAAVQAQLRPVPQLEAGAIAAELASAAIDVSDGLLQDLGHLCARSGCGARLDCESLPRSPAVREAEARAAKNGAHPYALSLGGGEEYALLLSVSPARAQRLLARLRSKNIAVQPIGRLTDRPARSSHNPILLLEKNRAVPPPARTGHDHLG